jgi:hypothetical protein
MTSCPRCSPLWLPLDDPAPCRCTGIAFSFHSSSVRSIMLSTRGGGIVSSSTVHSLPSTSSIVNFDKSYVTSITTVTWERCLGMTRSSFCMTCSSLITAPPPERGSWLEDTQVWCCAAFLIVLLSVYKTRLQSNLISNLILSSSLSKFLSISLIKCYLYL